MAVRQERRARRVDTEDVDEAARCERGVAMPGIQRFLIRAGGKPGRAIDLDTFPFTIGRARECNLVLDSGEISRLHAQLVSDHLHLYLEDLGSTNGTFVNGQRLEPGEPQRLRAGDEIHFGQSFSVVLDDPVTTMQIDPVQIPPPGLELNLDAATVKVGGQTLDPPLSPHQFALLALLVESAGRIVTREQIVGAIWGPGANIPDQTLDALVSRLRKRLQDADPAHDYLVTRRGFGLMFQNRKQSMAG